MRAYAKQPKAVVTEVMDFRLYAPADGGVTRKWVNRIAEELRTSYRAKFGRKGYTIRVERRRNDTGRTIFRVVALAPSAASGWETRV